MSVKKIYIDASFFIATQVINHPFHKKAGWFLKKMINDIFYFSLPTIDEIIYAFLQYQVDQETITSIINDKIVNIENVRLLNYPNDLYQIQSYLKIWNKSCLKPRDALHFYFMKVNNVKYLATFDNDFIKNEKKLGIKVVK